jgi:hypothetical protein
VLDINPTSGAWNYKLYEYNPGVGDGKITIVGGDGLSCVGVTGEGDTPNEESFTTNQSDPKRIILKAKVGNGIEITKNGITAKAGGGIKITENGIEHKDTKDTGKAQNCGPEKG